MFKHHKLSVDNKPSHISFIIDSRRGKYSGWCVRIGLFFYLLNALARAVAVIVQSFLANMHSKHATLSHCWVLYKVTLRESIPSSRATLPECTPSSQNIPPFKDLCAILPEFTPPSRNIPLFFTTICHTPIIYHSLKEYTQMARIPSTACQDAPEPFQEDKHEARENDFLLASHRHN